MNATLIQQASVHLVDIYLSEPGTATLVELAETINIKRWALGVGNACFTDEELADVVRLAKSTLAGEPHAVEPEVRELHGVVRDELAFLRTAYATGTLSQDMARYGAETLVRLLLRQRREEDKQLYSEITAFIWAV